jgi:cardiolipin synthase (CMP-forming)
MSPASDTPAGRALRQLPNAITLLRAVLIPVIGGLLASERYVAAFWTLLVSAASDFVDGRIARRFDARTRFGAIADPLADKLTMLTVTALLAWQGLLPVWLAGAIILRDVLIVGGALAYHRLIGAVDVVPTQLSRLNTALEFTALAAVIAAAAGLIDLDGLLPGLLVAVFVTVIASGAQYVWIWSRRALAARRGARVPSDRPV